MQDNGLTLNGKNHSGMRTCDFKRCCWQGHTKLMASVVSPLFQVSCSLIRYLSRGADMKPHGLYSGSLVMTTTLIWPMITFTLSMSSDTIVLYLSTPMSFVYIADSYSITAGCIAIFLETTDPCPCCLPSHLSQTFRIFPAFPFGFAFVMFVHTSQECPGL